MHSVDNFLEEDKLIRIPNIIHIPLGYTLINNSFLHSLFSFSSFIGTTVTIASSFPDFLYIRKKTQSISNNISFHIFSKPNLINNKLY